MNILKSLTSDKLRVFLYKRSVELKNKYAPVDAKYRGKNETEIFTEVYNHALWAQGKEGKYLKEGAKFYSGSGSYNESSVQYVGFITEYIQANNIKSVTDIGCGDFNIGKQVCELNPGISYNGVDVVPDLINYNNDTFKSENIKFYCLNTLSEKIPGSELLLIRQVLQHLSNDSIVQLAKNCFPGFKHILITEHHPKPQYLIRENMEKPSGPNVRIGRGSGVYLNMPPFNYKWINVLKAEDDNPLTEINTFKIDTDTAS